MKEVGENYPPFEIFKTVCIVLIDEFQLTKDEGLKRLVEYWVIMQGIVSFMISPNIELDGNWADYLKNIF